MPELPEVETCLRGIEPHIIQQTIQHVTVRQPQLRWPIPDDLSQQLIGTTINQVKRRGKYLLLLTTQGSLMIHLGMSGSLRIVDPTLPARKHDHIDIIFAHQRCLRYTDPRRFGAVLWTTESLEQHPLLRQLGPEPLTQQFNANYLQQLSQTRHVPIKTLLMNSHVVVGIGNIYATEALFLSGINPHRPAKQLTLAEHKKLIQTIKIILQQAINKGGTTLKDFTQSDGKPGYFQLDLSAYGRGGLPCRHCGKPLMTTKLNQRTTVFCAHCQQ